MLLIIPACSEFKFLLSLSCCLGLPDHNQHSISLLLLKSRSADPESFHHMPVIEHRRSQAELDGKLLGTQLEALQKAKAESDEQARAQESDRTRMWELTSNN